MRINRRGLDNAPLKKYRNVKADLVHVGIDRAIDAAQSGIPVADAHLGKRPMDFYL
jgi:hypothetical protein